MIEKWSKQNLKKDLEYVYGGQDEFIDERGKISNFELTEPINLIGLITSKKGTPRQIIFTLSKNKNVYSLKAK